MRNVVFLLIDGCEYSVFENMEFTRTVAPTLAGLIDDGYAHKIVSNGQITVISLATIFSHTYPLDHGGYNYGIRDRSKALIEVFKEAGYRTAFIASSDISGPRRFFERGADVVRAIYNHEDIIESYLRGILYFDMHRYHDGELGKQDLIAQIDRQFSEILSYAERPFDRFDRRFSPRRLREPTARTRRRLRAERELLNLEPDAIFTKMEKIPSYLYQKFLGERIDDFDDPSFRRRLKRYKIRHELAGRVNSLFKQVTRLGIAPFPMYIAPTAREVIDEAVPLIPVDHQPWFAFIQLLDHHDGSKTSRYLNFVGKVRDVAKVRKARRAHPNHRDFWRDLTLPYVDRQITRIRDHLARHGQLENTTFVVFGDHGMGWDVSRGPTNAKSLGFRTHYEHINIPVIVSPARHAPEAAGLHDGMSISATVLKEAGVPVPAEFAGVSIDQPGKKIVIIENTGRGNCDPLRREIYFTLVSQTHKLMVMLDGKGFKARSLYDVREDPKEKRNIITVLGAHDIVRDMLKMLAEERGGIIRAKTGAEPVDLVDTFEVLTDEEMAKINPLKFKELKTFVE